MVFIIRLLIFVGAIVTTIFTGVESQEATQIIDCRNHTCHRMSTRNVNQHYQEHGCFCDDLCLYYNDCCWDYKPNILSGIKALTTECRSPTKHNDPVMMIISCPSDYTGSQHIINNCTKYSPDLISSIPVSGRNKQLVYRNVYCALCNGETNYIYWNQKLKCPNTTSSKDLQIDKLNYTKCSLSLQNPYPNSSHFCHESLFNSCSNSSDGKCETGKYGVVYSSSQNFYKNIHCFQCNRQVNETLTCEILPDSLTTDYTYISPSYFILINFNRGDVRLNDEKQLVSCPHGHWFDYVKGKCHHVFAFEPRSSNNKVLNCSLHRLQKHEYIMFPNQTVYRNSTKRFYDEDSYIIKNNSDVFVCHHRTRTGSLLETCLTFIGMGISLSALAFLIVVYMLMPAIWNLTGLIYLSFSISLFLAQILFLVSRYTTPQDACLSIALTIHYAFLASFFWLNVVTINVWMTVCRNPCEMMSRKGWKRFFFYSLYAWLAPLFIIIPAFLLDKHRPESKLAPGYGYNGVCWLNNNIGILLYFAVPLAIIILVNFAAYIHTAVTIYNMRKFSVQNSRKDNIKITIINAKLCLLTGITWIFGYVASLSNSKELRIVFVVLNATYGLWLAICFLTTENVFSQVKQKFRSVTQSSSTRTLT